MLNFSQDQNFRLYIEARLRASTVKLLKTYRSGDSSTIHETIGEIQAWLDLQKLVRVPPNRKRNPSKTFDPNDYM